jgi:hypothetical protein
MATVMRHLIRSKETGAFFFYGKWTANAVLAQEFPGLLEAAEAKRTFKLENVEVYYQVGRVVSPDYDFALPIS